jgi:hypothetical protein
MSYSNTWKFTGQTKESSDTIDLSFSPVDSFPTTDVVNTVQTAILSQIIPKFKEEMLKAGITVIDVQKIEPNCWVETQLYSLRQVQDKQENRWHHWLHMEATVYFTTDKPIIQSPIAPLILVALIEVIKYVILVTAIALVIYYIAKTFIESFFTTSHTITTYDPATGKTTSETITQPSWTGQIVTAVVVLGGLGLALWFILGLRKKRTARRRR